MGTRDWLSEWSRHARLLAEEKTPEARAALLDTNGDGRELWFGLDVRDPSSGEWAPALDWDDAGGHQPASRLDGTDVIFGWGTSKPRERRRTEHDGIDYAVRVGSNGWWLLLARVPR